LETVAERAVAEQGEDGPMVLEVREFENYLDARMQALGGVYETGTIASAQPASVATLFSVPTRKRPGDLTRQDIEFALRESSGNKTRAAAALGISVNTLKKRVAELK
jgi:DNA-binding NtrC family response regulator